MARSSSSTQLAGLRHQLLTPLNHIIGYSEMLLEDSRPDGFSNLHQNLARIRQTAKDMVRVVHSSLSPTARKRRDKIVTELRYELSAPLHTILQTVGAMTSENGDDQVVSDVLKIGRAATELLTFAQGDATLHPNDTPAPSKKQTPKQIRARTPGRILIVDDNRASRELLSRQLKRHGHQVTEAGSGAEALQLLIQSPQDVVLLDVLMPKLDGFQVLERIKSDPAMNEIPVIVLSALDEVPGVVRSIEIGAEDYLFKPFNPVLLAARIHASLEKKRLRDLEKRRAEDLEKAYQQVHLSEERLRLALQADHAGIWDLDLATNQIVESGRPQKSLEDALSVVDPADRERVRAALFEAIEKQAEFHCEFRARARGSKAWMEAMGTLQHGPNRTPLRMIGVTRNITARKYAEEALHKSNQDFERFAMAASHDLREPLRGVSRDLEALLQGRQNGQPHRASGDNRRTIRSAVDSLDRMSKLIGDLLDYSQMGAKKPKKQPISADAVLALVLSDLKLNLEESGAIVTHDKLPVLSADFMLLHRIFQNLISNSIKYRGTEPPRIQISARREAGDWVFSVADNGIGVDPKYQSSIFGLFRRLHGNEVPGSGVGLAICQRIVNQLEGSIWMESTVGKGSTFYFTVPTEEVAVSTGS